MFRENSEKTGDAYKLRLTPHRFRPNPSRPRGSYIAIPRHVRERRRYWLVQRNGPEIICEDANFVAEDPDSLFFGLVSSSMFITWQRTVGGRLESRVRFANTLTWNTFPIPEPDEQTRRRIIDGGKQVLDARALYLERSLADHYNPLAMSPELTKTHDNLDREVDKAMGPHANSPRSANAKRFSLLTTPVWLKIHSICQERR